MTTRQLVAFLTAFFLVGQVITYIVYGNIFAIPCFH